MDDTKSVRVSRAKSYFGDDKYHRKSYMSVRRSEIVSNLLNDIRGKSILDLGSGSGTVSLPLLPQCGHLTLLDYSQSALDIARSRVPAEYMNKIDFKVDDLLRFRGDAPYDVVLCIGVLAHVDSTEDVLRAVVANLAPGGQAIVQMTPAENLLSRLFFGASPMRPLKYRATRGKDVIQSASSLGLQLVARQRHLLLVPGAMQLLGPVLLPYDRWIARSPLSRFGVSELLLFRRAA